MGSRFVTEVVNRNDGPGDRFVDPPPRKRARLCINFRDVIFTPLSGEPIRTALQRLAAGHKDGVPFASIVGRDIEDMRAIHAAGVGTLTATMLDAFTKLPSHRIVVEGIVGRSFLTSIRHQAFAVAVVTFKASDRLDVHPRYEILPPTDQ